MLEDRLGRFFLAMLFAAGAVQKLIDPDIALGLLEMRGWPLWLIWPAILLNFVGAICLLVSYQLRIVALLLADYCAVTSWFHFLPDDGWQMSIFIKNWAIAGGLLILAGSRRTR